MQKAFLETSAINAFCDNKMSGEEVRIFLKNKSFLPVVGIFTTFELANTFLNDRDIEKAKKLFLLLKELNPEYSYQNKELFLMESWKLKYNLSINPFINSEKLLELNIRIEEFLNGNVDDFLKWFLGSKSKNIYNSRFLWKPENFNPQIRELFENFPEYRNGYLRDYNISLLKEFLKETAEIKLHDSYLIKLMNDIHSYPVIRTHLYHHLYLNFTSDKHTPAKDRIPDNMQLKGASYFPVFISHDLKHLKYANEINPDIQLVSTQSLGIA